LLRIFLLLTSLLFLPEIASAEEAANLGLTGTQRGLYCVLIFIISYAFVMTEEFTHLRKSKPVILAAGIIWAHVAYMAASSGVPAEKVHKEFEHNLKE
jgi:hypothetical protein